VAVLLAGCGTSQKEDQANNQGSSQRMSEATNATLVDRCADSASTGEQQKGVGNVLDMLAGLLGKAGVRERGEVSRGEVSRGEVSNGKIAFSPNYDIHVINGEGAHESRLTHTAHLSEQDPVWSPDGGKIAFITPDYTPGEEKSALYVMNADGTNKTQLALDLDLWSYPSWSPDGQKIAFTTGADTPNDLYVINVDGTHKVGLITDSISGNSEDETQLGSPVWSPTGNEIAFASHTVHPVPDNDAISTSKPSSVPAEGLTGIYLIEADGTGLCKLTSTVLTNTAEFLGYSPVWSPDGERIAFYDMETTNVINIDGSGRKPLARGASAAWSPDGQKLAFVNDSSVLDVINADGSGVRRLANTTTAAPGIRPAWSPDGEKIAFPCPAASGAAGTDLCVINADGTEWKRIALKVLPDKGPLAVSWGRE
jgi:Tol biopolymer transport system component